MKFDFTINDEPNTIEEPRARKTKFVPRSQEEISSRISESARLAAHRMMAKKVTSVSVAEYEHTKERVKALPDGHNDFFDFLSSWDNLRNYQMHFRYRFFARIEELEEIHQVAA